MISVSRKGVLGSTMQQSWYNRIVTACLVVAVGSALAYEPSGEYKWIAVGVAAVAAVTALILHLARHLLVPFDGRKVSGTLGASPSVTRHGGGHKPHTLKEVFVGGRVARPARISSSMEYSQELWEEILGLSVRSEDYRIEISQEVAKLVEEIVDVAPGNSELRTRLFLFEPSVVTKRNVKRKHSHLNIGMEAENWKLFTSGRYMMVYGTGSAKSSGWSKLSRFRSRAGQPPEWLDNLSSEAIKARRSAARRVN